jgi:amino acid transporter
MADETRRFGRDDDPGTNAGTGRGSVAVGEREQAERTRAANPPPVQNERGGDVDRGTSAHDVRARQRDEFGGFNWGSAFFGWLVAIGIGALLTAVLAAAGTAIGLTNSNAGDQAKSNADTIGIGGGILLLLVSMIAYYAGGYVAGRMSRFDGARQGFGVWVFGLIVTVAIAAAGWILGDKYNILDKLNLPRIPVNAGDLTTGGLIALAAILLGTLIAAIAGGKVGQRYHNKVDRAGFGEKV